MTDPAPFDSLLLADIRHLIDAARQRVAVAVNAELSLLYWRIGRRIDAEVLQGQRAEYGKQIVSSVAKRLTAEYGRGWSEPQLRHCLRVAEAFRDEAIFSTVRRELSWSHIKTLIYLDEPIKRDFYIEICRHEHWSVRQLQERIQSMLYERTAISRKPEETVRKDLTVLREEGRLSSDLAFRDPYVLDFLGLADSYSEKDLESAILAELLKLDKSNIRVADYLTVLPPRETLQAKLHQSIENARQRLLGSADAVD